MDDISFVRPVLLVNLYYVIGAFSLLINFLGSYLVIFKSSKLDTFKWYLLWFQLSCTVCDVYGTLIDQPVMMYPVWAAYSAGVVQNYVSTRLASTLYNCFIQQEFCALCVCFLRKYRSIVKLEDPQYRLSLWKTVLLSQSISFINAVCFYYVSMDKSKSMGIIREVSCLAVVNTMIGFQKYPSIAAGFESLTDFVYWHMSPELVVWLVVYTISMSACNNTIFYTTRRMTKILRDKSQLISKATSSKHKMAINSLIAQCMSAGVMVFPMLIFILLMILNIGHLQVMTWCVCTTLLTHSAVNCMVMILTFPPYRRAVLFWKKEKSKRDDKIQSSSTFAIASANN
ncbi:hypothetical protein CAEBREN_20210 [Caenorhabditis brenneri]|uniref:Uncharacterized protein n=1 Tax=Caenorhabditis brenneri TaxID=135651 RepID=G0N8T4_CAEBE|nr:hypothetical protein CAEBREN_20210 [Caenorhabditis brenneri]